MGGGLQQHPSIRRREGKNPFTSQSAVRLLSLPLCMRNSKRYFYKSLLSWGNFAQPSCAHRPPHLTPEIVESALPHSQISRRTEWQAVWVRTQGKGGEQRTTKFCSEGLLNRKNVKGNVPPIVKILEIIQNTPELIASRGLLYGPEACC